MKKLFPLLLAILFILPSSASAYIVYLGFDATVPLADVVGFEVEVTNVDPTLQDLQTYTTEVAVLGGFGSFDPLVPGLDFLANWDVFPAGQLVSAIESSLPPTVFPDPLPNPLNPGTAWSLESASVDPFDLINFTVLSYSTGELIPLNVIISDLGAEVGKVYTLSQVPVPSAIFLLAPGLLALLGLRRKLS